MRKRIYSLSFLILGALSFTHCVSPYYGTARIEPGWNVTCGAALHSCIVPVTDVSGYSIGLREDIFVSYGFNRYLGAHIQAGFGTAIPEAPGFVDGLAGLQAALPLGPLTLSLRADIASYYGFLSISPMFLMGVGKREYVTISVSTHSDFFFQEQHYYPVILGLGIHPTAKWSLFCGADVKTLMIDDYGRFEPIATIGLGYQLSRDGVKKETHVDFSVMEKTWGNWGIPRLHLMKADIIPGWHIHPGVALLAYLDTDFYEFRIGIEGDVELSYGLNQYVRFYTHASTGSLGLWGDTYFMAGFTPGFQVSLPLRSITPSIMVDLTFSEDYGGISSSLLTSIGSKENFSVGTRLRWCTDYEVTHLWDWFANYQVTPQWLVFGGVEVLGFFDPSRSPFVELGVKYTLSDNKKKDK